MPIDVHHISVPADGPALAEALAASGLAAPALTMLFASTEGPLAPVAAAVRAQVTGPVLACTTAGELGPGGVQAGTVVGLQLAGDLRATVFAVPRVGSVQARDLGQVTEQIAAHIARQPAGWSLLGVVLVDGLSGAEERLMAGLGAALPGLELVGGSAGDALRFEHTAVWWEGEFRQDTATIAIIASPHPIRRIKTQHVRPRGAPMVITAADPARRTVHEIDALPAATFYARLVGLPEAELGPAVFSQHPLVLNIGGDPHVRSIQRVGADGSLVFFCAIDEGLVLYEGEADDLVADLDAALARATQGLGEAPVVVGFDCILRRLEILDKGIGPAVSRISRAHGLVGFHTFGEQHGSVHVNQTFTGFALGTR